MAELKKLQILYLPKDEYWLRQKKDRRSIRRNTCFKVKLHPKDEPFPSTLLTDPTCGYSVVLFREHRSVIDGKPDDLLQSLRLVEFTRCLLGVRRIYFANMAYISRGEIFALLNTIALRSKNQEKNSVRQFAASA